LGVRFILPVKGHHQGKTRLAVSPEVREALIVAMLRDCVAAVLATDLGEVVVVTPDPDLRAISREDGATAVDHAGGLNEAISAALGPHRNAVLLPDVPAVRPEQLLDVLGTWDSGFVPDRAGTGTTMLFGADPAPQFGPGSAARHEAAGIPRIALPECGLTVDVDTAQDLQIARGLGLGRHTAAVLTRAQGPIR